MAGGTGIYLTCIIGILLFFGGLSIFLSFVSEDTALALAFNDTSNYSISPQTYIYANETTPSISKIGILDMTTRIFTFRIPEYMMPTVFNIFITFFNYFLLLILVICFYRVLNPLS